MLDKENGEYYPLLPLQKIILKSSTLNEDHLNWIQYLYDTNPTFANWIDCYHFYNEGKCEECKVSLEEILLQIILEMARSEDARIR